MLILCRVNTLANIGTTYHLTEREYPSMGALLNAIRHHPEEFTPGRYTLIDKRPVVAVEATTQLSITLEK